MPIAQKDSFWTDERIEQLTNLWTAGWSCSQVGRVLGCSRSAVIGKVGRLGMLRGARQPPTDPNARLQAMRGHAKNPPHRMREYVKSGDQRVKASVPPVRPPPVAVVASAVVVSLNARVWTERGSGCAWPVGTVIGADQLSCANRCEPGERYCAGHRARMHVAATGAWKADRLMRLARAV